MKEIPLTRGKVALVDDDDYERVAALRWFARCKGRVWYAVRNTVLEGRNSKGRLRTSVCYMHRFILDPPADKTVDHRDGNGLNNQRANLRFCTKSQNQHNQVALAKGNSSGFRGVSKHPSCNRWRSVIKHERQHYDMGLHRTPEDAARAWDAKARELFGEFASLNFPNEGEQGVRR